jgi:guanylate kinase
MPENLHKLFVISSPSGGGKTSLINKLFEDSRSANFEKSISDTSRQKRQGDLEGKDYYFLSENDFKNKIKKEEYVEYATVFGNFYGTSKEEIKIKYNNSNLILELDWQGAYAVKELFDDAKLIFLVPPSLDDLKQRLIKRNLDSSEAIENRLSEAKKEISKSEMYDYLVLNDDFDKAFEDLSQILFEGISPIDFNSRVSKDLIKRLVE